MKLFILPKAGQSHCAPLTPLGKPHRCSTPDLPPSRHRARRNPTTHDATMLSDFHPVHLRQPCSTRLPTIHVATTTSPADTHAHLHIHTHKHILRSRRETDKNLYRITTNTHNAQKHSSELTQHKTFRTKCGWGRGDEGLVSGSATAVA